MASVSHPTNGTVTFDVNTQTVTFVPTSGYTGTAVHVHDRELGRRDGFRQRFVDGEPNGEYLEPFQR